MKMLCRFKIIALIFGMLFMVSCEKDTWKEPTEVGVSFDIKRTSQNSSLSFSGGQLLLREFQFDGLRVQADDVYFEREYEGGVIIDFNATQPNDQLYFDIPQGTYTSIRIDIQAEESDNQKLTIEGAFSDASGSQTPILLEYALLELYDKIALDNQGGQEIDLVAGTPSSAFILFDPFHWFSSISDSQLENATTSNINGVQTIQINEDVNSDLFDLITDKIGSKVEITFQ